MSDKNKKDAGGGLDDLDQYARQIWLAGLGAYTRLGKEGSKLFDALISEGKDAEKTAGRGSLDSARNKVEKARKKLGSKFGDWETLFDKRLQGATERMGLASQAELQALAARVEELTRAVEKLSAVPAAPAKRAAKTSADTAATAKPAKQSTAAKPAAKQPPTKGKATPRPAAAVKSASKSAGAASAAKAGAGSNTKSAGTAGVKTTPRRRSTAPKAATRGKTSPAPATDAAPGTPPEL